MTQAPQTVEVFQELRLVGGPGQLDATRAAILSAAEAAAPAWRPAREDELRRSRLDEDVIALVRAGDDMAPNALVFLLRTDGAYRVTNIVPEKVGELGRSRYNLILQEFIEQFAQTAARQSGASLETTDPHETLEDFLGAQGARKLRAFSTLANMSTGSSHPMDRERWYDFIIAVEGRDVDGDTLARWLRALEWPEDSAWRLVIEFQFGEGLLQRLREF